MDATMHEIAGVRKKTWNNSVRWFGWIHRRASRLSVRRFLREVVPFASEKCEGRYRRVRFGPRCFALKGERSRGERAPSITREREKLLRMATIKKQ